MPVSAMKARFQIAECSLSSAKRYKNNFFQKTDRCNYLEYSRDEVLVIYESLLATKKIREIREIRERLRNNIECWFLNTNFLNLSNL